MLVFIVSPNSLAPIYLSAFEPLVYYIDPLLSIGSPNFHCSPSSTDTLYLANKIKIHFSASDGIPRVE